MRASLGRLSTRVVLIGGLALLMLAGLRPARAQWPNANPSYQTGFPVAFPEGDSTVRYSSVALGDVTGDELPEIVVGSKDGKVEVFMGDGSHLWTFDTGEMAIEGKPAIGDVNGDGWNEIVIGAGSTFTPTAAGVLHVLSHTGTSLCSFIPDDSLPPGGGNGIPDGIFSSPALVDLDGDDDGKLEIVFGGFDGRVRVLHHDCTEWWSDWVRDTIWSSPAIGDLDHDGDLEIVIGVDSHQENDPYNTEDGGRLMVYTSDGSSQLPGFPIQIDEVIHSAPALGDIDGDDRLDIVVGTGYCWSSPSCSPTSYPGVGEYVNAWDRNGVPLDGWPVSIPGRYAKSSPSLVNIDADPELEVVINVVDKETTEGWIYVFDGDGSTVPGWPQQPQTPATCDTTVSFGTRASPIIGDLDGDLELEIVIPSNAELVVFDLAGNQLSRNDACPDPAEMYTLRTGFSVSGSAAMGDLDGDGDVELVAASGQDSTNGALFAWDFAAESSELLQPWPEFRRTNDGWALVGETPVFGDGFESGDTTKWSVVTP